MNFCARVVLGIGSAAALVACGARSPLDHQSDGALPSNEDGPFVLPPGAAPPSEGCDAPIFVPQGGSWIGVFVLTDEFVWEQHACESDGHLDIGTRQFQVPPFFLDATEVTNGCYENCVAAGRCPALPDGGPEYPGGESYPAEVPRDAAEQFCAFRGGNIPSIAKLARATVGDEFALFPDSLLAAYAACPVELAATDEDCHKLGLRMESPVPLEPVKTDPRDVGPWGHRDLAMSALEFTTTSIDVDTYCGYSGTTEPASFGDSSSPYMFGPAKGTGLPFAGTGEMMMGAHKMLPADLRGGFRCMYAAEPDTGSNE